MKFQSSTKEEFVKKAKLVHGDKYDYCKVNYIGSAIKVVIICPEHGEFEQTPHGHLSGKGCFKCAGKNMTTEDFIKKARKIYGDRYDYSKSVYTLSRNLITIICPKHGEFNITANSHLRNHECVKCRYENHPSRPKYTKEQLIKRCRKVWGDRFDLSELVYTGIRDSHRIKCNKCGSYFNQILDSLLNQKSDGCRNCSPNARWTRTNWVEFCNGKDRLDPMVYIVNFFDDNESFIKIGITSRSIHERLVEYPFEYKVIKTIIGSPLFVYDEEIRLHRKFREYKYSPIKQFVGSTECFSLDILPLIDHLT